jgi:hypothetical protein
MELLASNRQPPWLHTVTAMACPEPLYSLTADYLARLGTLGSLPLIHAAVATQSGVLCLCHRLTTAPLTLLLVVFALAAPAYKPGQPACFMAGAYLHTKRAR